ncbi:GH36-type glycosyl hydrolase domain-containing protein [Clostridium thermarum]|uniref:GH36-type glycosyl hydrolase domain-containing protein n=1 Tax=Clostridium thermarum TaxID=1716543 RepID=UPI0013D31125|nr:glucoamylase family protein [Clostridium thermarum]
MIYIYLSILTAALFWIIHIALEDYEYIDENIMEDVPNIYVNNEELEKHAVQISTHFSETKKMNSKRRLIKSLDKSFQNILKGYDYIDKEADSKREMVPAAEWLLDNLYLIQKEYKDIKSNMPESYYKNLPVISKGIMKGYPRVYQIAVEIISHTDGLVDEVRIERFINAYQKNTILTSGELWALPIMLRIALIQNISHIVEKIVYALKEKRQGEIVADRIINAYADKKLKQEIEILRNIKFNFSSHFVERIIKVIRDNGVDSDEVYTWLNENLEANQSNIEKTVSREHRKQANYQISLGNSINSIRVLGALDWKHSFEKLSYVEQILKEDPAQIYSKMDFESRDNYRHSLEVLARKARIGEALVAKKVIECAKSEDKEDSELYKKHIGYYLIDDGINILKKKIKYKPGIPDRLADTIKNHPLFFYLGILICGMGLIETATLLLSLSRDNDVVLWRYIIGVGAILIPCSEIVISILNRSINSLANPKFVPKLSLEDGIPVESSTVVVIPTLVNSEKRAKELIDDLEVYYLANSEKNLYFALLADFPDSKEEHSKNDEAIVNYALKNIRQLNEKYCQENNDIFYFLCRYRKYNDKQGVWMGWERKRGKLMEFNALLRGDKNTTYNVISSDLSQLKAVKYVITLDADTILPRDAAKRLIGAMSHVLNRAVIDKNKKKVIRGYGIMQPRVSVATLVANKTPFSRIFSGETGLDMYTSAVSDVYQDLFGEGIFTGKGIYDIDVFETVLKGEIPENAVLSHDLLEGNYARTALVTDIELIDGYPAYYNSSSKRLHRWVRGDWQLLPWLFKKSSLSGLSKWKIFDNLRRSLITPSIGILILLALSILPTEEPWIIVAFLSIICPVIFDVSDAVVAPSKGLNLTGRFRNVIMAAEQIFLLFCFIPYMAYLMCDAIIRTLYRLFISKRNLLEWQTAADAEATSGKDFKSYISRMWPASVLAALIGVLAFNNYLYLGLILLPSTILWFVSPYIAYYISKEYSPKEYTYSKEDGELLRRLSREIWAYFEDFVNSENNWLAPDNYQESPPNGVAHRTSPTNIGMGLTSNICAHDLGYIGISETIDRIDKTMISIEGLIGYKGHLFNWYDTVTKEPLYPRYISTVDSGNMVAYMWLAARCLEIYLNQPLLSKNYIAGIEDTIRLAAKEIEEKTTLKAPYEAIMKKTPGLSMDLVSWKSFLLELWSKVIEVEKNVEGKSLYWNSKLKNSCSKFLSELQRYVPWVDIACGENHIPQEIKNEFISIVNNSSFKDITVLLDRALQRFRKLNNDNFEDNDFESFSELIAKGNKEIMKHINRASKLIRRLVKFVENTDFRVVYDRKRQLFSIGYDMEKDALNNSYYDLLASEARCASFMAIAKGDVEQKHWFKLGRAMTFMGKSKGLVSWSGTMFEYFMPLLIMKTYPDTLIDETYKAVIEGQKIYCRERNVPWGISESAFYYFDNAMNYQYKAFGIPGIGLKRGLSNELVVSPYATVISLQKGLKEGVENIKRLIKEGMEGKYGLYEAVDYTKERLPKGKNKAVVKCFMVHHQGMSLMALNNVLNGDVLVERFHSIPEVKATELLLQEKVPRNVVYDREVTFKVHEGVNEKYSLFVRAYNTALTEVPETHILSNGTYSMMISNSGSGYAKKEDMTLYRWREDATDDSSGMFFYIKNLNDNTYWSSTYEPCKNEGTDYQVIFSMDKVEFKRRDGNISSHTEITVSGEDNAEIRRINLTNHGKEEVIFEITSYCEVTLAPYNTDLVHPAFSNLFIGTEYVEATGCILANRRPRAKGQKKPWLMQTIALQGEAIGSLQYETSRLNFIGRGRTLYNPVAMDKDAPLQNTTGAVLDPIISMRRRIRLRGGESCKIAFTIAVADSKEEAIELSRKYREFQNINRAFELSWTESQVEMKYMGIKSTQANLYQIMASKILFINEQLTQRGYYIRNIKKHQRDLWAYGISGDLPIVLLIIRHENDLDYVRQLMSAHEYWGLKGLKVDLIILNLEEVSYAQPLQNSVRDMLAMRKGGGGNKGNIFIHNKTTMDEGTIELLMAIARLVIDSENGSFMEQINGNNQETVNLIRIQNLNDNELDKDAVSYIRTKTRENQVINMYKNRHKSSSNRKETILDKFRWRAKSAYSVEFSSEIAALSRKIMKIYYDPSDLYFFNGYGGFSKHNNAYVIILENFKITPAPWINVISNDKFGFHISESGSAYTWSRNSRENKITTWTNDPVCDLPGEALFIRDEESGDFWSITPKPMRDNGTYIIEHGFGYSRFIHEAYGIEGQETMFVPSKESCKVLIVSLKNRTERRRTLSATYYAHLVLGVTPQSTAQYITTEIDEVNKYITGQNPYSEHFGTLKAYLHIAGGKEESFTGSRKEFLGRGKSIFSPQGMRKDRLSNICGAGIDPCLCENVKLDLEPDEEKTLIVILGQCESTEELQNCIRRYGNLAGARSAFEESAEYWKNILGRIKVTTPDKSMDLLLNGWLMYQTLACRYWSRTAFYQSGGAYGYRDQLQDSMNIGLIEKEITREQIKRSAERQFLEGDVQHWWHPVVDSGIRTRFSDDLLWLPYVTAEYVKSTGDYSILEERAGYLEDEPLKDGEDERYTVARKSEVTGTIYEHCIKAIERALKFGVHNIPLMGSGDWNDGMSTVGNEGKGESVWMGWFLYSILTSFKDICSKLGDIEKVEKYTVKAEFIKENLEKYGWDGSWYRRAYFDDGTPLGSIQNDECQIDSLAQSWSIISGAGDKERAKQAMASLEKYLVKHDLGIILLLTPAFDNSKLEPGYIKGYVPGVRENGAQYTHAAIWVILAEAMLGNGDKAWKYFNMINPINHSETTLECERYKVEPYVMAADVYMREPHGGRGGWSWYTGAAGWMYRVGIEAILGLRYKGEKGFTIEPAIPNSWEEYKIEFRRGNSEYNITVRRGAEKSISLNGVRLENGIVPWQEAGEHKVEVTL